MVFAFPLLVTSSENDFLSSAMETTFPETALGCADCCPCWGREENGWANAGNPTKRSAARDPRTRNLQHILPVILTIIRVPPEGLVAGEMLLGTFRSISTMNCSRPLYAHKKRFVLRLLPTYERFILAPRVN